MLERVEEARIEVYTFKEGALSAAVGHDLRMQVERYEIRTDGRRVEATLWPASIEVLGAVFDGELRPGALSLTDRQQILEAMQKHVLHTDEHPLVHFEGVVQRVANGYEVTGQLEILGKRSPIRLAVTEEGGRWRGSVDIVPSRFGVRPYRTMMGMLKLADRVRVAYDVAIPEALRGGATEKVRARPGR